MFRDPSAWYHIVFSVDTTQATTANRVKIYVNGVQQTSTTAYSLGYLALNVNTFVNFTNPHTLGSNPSYNLANYLDGYLTEINLIDGQQLTPSDFGDYNSDTGVWQPIEYEGTYGTNGFYLPFKPTTQATGFNTVLYTGNGGTQTIDNIGFSPDLVWLKNRGTTNSHYLSDTVRGNEKAVNSNTNAAEFNYTPYGGLSFVPNGFYVETGTSNVFNTSGNNFVAWCWDAGTYNTGNTNVFNGSSQSLSVVGSADMALGSRDCTVECYFKVDSLVNYRSIIDNRPTGGSSAGV